MGRFASVRSSSFFFLLLGLRLGTWFFFLCSWGVGMDGWDRAVRHATGFLLSHGIGIGH